MNRVVDIEIKVTEQDLNLVANYIAVCD